MSERQQISTSPPLSGVLSVREAAALLHVNVKTLYAEIKAKRFPAIHLGRAIRIPRAVLTAALEQGRPATAQAAAHR
jgi:excisionase family DNA binding protein